MVVLTQQILEGTNDNGKRTKDEINVPMALSAFRDKRQTYMNNRLIGTPCLSAMAMVLSIHSSTLSRYLNPLSQLRTVSDFSNTQLGNVPSR